MSKKEDQLDEFKADHSGSAVVPGSEISGAADKNAEDPKADGKKKKGAHPKPTITAKDASVKAEETESDDEVVVEADEDVEYTKADMINAVLDSMKDKSKLELESMFGGVMDSLNEADDDDDDDDDEDDEDDDKKSKKKGNPFAKVTKEDVDLGDDVVAMFGDEDLSEEFKQNATMIFEAAVVAKINENLEILSTKNSAELTEATDTMVAEISQKVDNYLEYVVEEWVEENEVAIDSGIRNELAESVVSDLRNLLADHFIDIPEEKADIVEELGLRVQDLESQLDEAINSSIDLKNDNVSHQKGGILADVTEGLVDTQVEKLRSLAEGVDFEDEDDYRARLTTMKESYFPTDGKSVSLTEEISDEAIDDGSENEQHIDPAMAPYVNAISKTTKR